MLINKPKLLGVTVLHIIIFTIVVGISAALSQDYQKDPLTWGIKAGVNVSDFYGDDAESTDAREDFSGGILLNYRFNDHWALQPEVMFNIKGADLNTGLAGENGQSEYKFGYLNIPILAKYYIPTGTTLTPNLYAGPEVGFKLYGESNGNDIDNEVKNAEFGIAFGTGLDFDIGSEPANLIRTVGLDLRYSLGLTNVFDIPQEPEARNGVFLAALFLGF